MPNPNPVAEALALLRQRRDHLLAEVEQVAAAIAALDGLVGNKTAPPERTPSGGRSVRTLVVSLMEEADRDWSTAEMLAEYERRGTPVHGKNPSNAMRAALADAKKRELIVSTGVGRYKAAKWKAAENGSSPSWPSSPVGDLLGREVSTP